jgi:DNA-binding transcriptional LysR family regulator
MNWDDLRYVLALARSGSLVRAAKTLQVEHTTVARRVESAESRLGVQLFVRTKSGYLLTADAERLLASMAKVEEAVLAVERGALAEGRGLEGLVRITAPETFGMCYLAQKLAALRAKHPGITIALVPSGEILDLGRSEAEIALRTFRSKHAYLVARRAGMIRYGLYASRRYLASRPLSDPKDLLKHNILGVPEQDAIEARWLLRLCPTAKLHFVSTSSFALMMAAKASAGVAILPRYLADAEPLLRRIPTEGEPSEPIWLTVHRDVRKTPRVRTVLDFLAEAMQKDAALLSQTGGD